MTIELETWLKQATRHLSRDSASQVRTENPGTLRIGAGGRNERRLNRG
jgi:hypothetical protein